MRQREIWKAIPGSCNCFVSNMGRVRGALEHTAYGDGRPRVRLPIKRKKLSGAQSINGRKVKWFSVQLLVLEIFKGKRPKGGVCRHLNDCPADNRASNLAWGTVSQNSHDAIRNGKLKTFKDRDDMHAVMEKVWIGRKMKYGGSGTKDPKKKRFQQVDAWIKRRKMYGSSGFPEEGASRRSEEAWKTRKKRYGTSGVKCAGEHWRKRREKYGPAGHRNKNT